MSIHRACLVLNASYEPISIASARRGVELYVKGVAVIEEDYDREIYPGIMLPSVVRLREYRRIPMRTTVLKRKNIYARDHNTCQYCGVKLNPKFLTLDHIIPKSKGGLFSWHNLVACCHKCNRKKADRTLEESGMTLLHKPRPLTVHTHKCLIRLIGLEEDKKWSKYLYTKSDEIFT